ncbi:MAG: hypothetical protein FJ387_05340 [Verrucomicrobia bacterium]|nr:hypothetical protein [Verrucomicrobiota bacterium]
MKFLFRWLFRLVVLTLLLVMALVLLKDAILKELLELELRQQTGLQTKIGELEVRLFSPTVSVERLRLFNPPEFGGSPFLDIPELYLEYDRLALAAHQLHLRLLRVQVAELTLVQSLDGRKNTDWLASLPDRFARNGLEFAGIDTLNLTLTRIKRYSMHNPRLTETVEVGLRQEILTRLDTGKAAGTALGLLAAQRGLQPLTNWFPGLRLPR